MNEYKITYSGESEGYRLVVDRTEAAAKKYFREQAKELDLGRISIESVELVSDNAMATKRNERETLEVIRQLVTDLGEQSYLATAFEGCFEDAEDNIDDDAAYSYKGRYENVRGQLDEAKKKIKELEEQLAESQKDWEAAHAANHALADEKDAEIAALQSQVLSPDDLEDVRQLLAERVDQVEEQAQKAAAEIVRFAEAPALPEFGQAVKMNRECTATAKYYRDLLKRVQAIQASYNAGA